eukprot:3111912-Amphidinium_carterae.1
MLSRCRKQVSILRNGGDVMPLLLEQPRLRGIQHTASLYQWACGPPTASSSHRWIIAGPFAGIRQQCKLGSGNRDMHVLAINAHLGGPVGLASFSAPMLIASTMGSVIVRQAASLRHKHQSLRRADP